MAISGTVGRINLSGLSVELIPVGSVFAGVKAPFILKISNEKRFFPAFLISVEVMDSRVSFSVVLPEGNREKIVYLVFPERGRVKDVLVRFVSPFPFRFFYRWRVVRASIKFIVYPRPLRCSFREIETFQGRREQLQGIGDGEFLKIRDYIPGDEPRRIHWKISAKRGSLFTKEFTDTGDVPVVIDLQQIAGSTEERLSKATYLILRAFRSGRPVGMRADDFYVPPSKDESEKKRMLEFLALYGKEKL